MTTIAVPGAQRAVALFHALSDETRLAILELLRDGERCVCELTDALDVAQSRLSFHLRVLRDAGLVSDRRDGRWIYYTAERSGFTEAESLLASLRPRGRRALPQRGAACCD
jgi:ArsR family transcriptional regulator, arsenate/arsenite/antimonite-responsive transcriptional repressor